MDLNRTDNERLKSAYFFAMLSVVIGIMGRPADAFISRNVLKAEGVDDKAVAALAFLTIGGLMGTVVFVILAHTPFGGVLDPKWRGLRFGTKRFQQNVLVGGLSGAMATGLYLFSFQKGFDAAMIVALSSSQMIWIMGYERWRYKDRSPIRSIASPACLMIAGVWIGQGISQPSLEAVLLVFFGVAILSAVSGVHDKIAAEESNATLATVWRFFYLAVFGTALSVAYVWHIGKMPVYLGLIHTKWFIAILPIAILMTFNFLAGGWAARAKAHLHMGASRISLIGSLGIVGTLLALAVLNFVFGTSKFGPLSADWVLLRKGLGAFVITASVIWLIRNKDQNKVA